MRRQCNTIHTDMQKCWAVCKLMRRMREEDEIESEIKIIIMKALFMN